MVKATQALNASTKRYHKTQALMGATRLASEKYYAFYTLHFIMRVLPVKTVMPPGHHGYEGADLLLEQRKIRSPITRTTYHTSTFTQPC